MNSTIAQTALMEACVFGHRECVELLLRSGADKEARSVPAGNTALMLACTFGHATTAQALIDAGADKDARGANGSTALILASFFGHVPTVGQSVISKESTNKHRSCDCYIMAS